MENKELLKKIKISKKFFIIGMAITLICIITTFIIYYKLVGKNDTYGLGGFMVFLSTLPGYIIGLNIIVCASINYYNNKKCMEQKKKHNAEIPLSKFILNIIGWVLLVLITSCIAYFICYIFVCFAELIF